MKDIGRVHKGMDSQHWTVGMDSQSEFSTRLQHHRSQLPLHKAVSIYSSEFKATIPNIESANLEAWYDNGNLVLYIVITLVAISHIFQAGQLKCEIS